MWDGVDLREGVNLRNEGSGLDRTLRAMDPDTDTVFEIRELDGPTRTLNPSEPLTTFLELPGETLRDLTQVLAGAAGTVSSQSALLPHAQRLREALGGENITLRRLTAHSRRGNTDNVISLPPEFSLLSTLAERSNTRAPLIQLLRWAAEDPRVLELGRENTPVAQTTTTSTSSSSHAEWLAEIESFLPPEQLRHQVNTLEGDRTLAHAVLGEAGRMATCNEGERRERSGALRDRLLWLV